MAFLTKERSGWSAGGASCFRKYDAKSDLIVGELLCKRSLLAMSAPSLLYIAAGKGMCSRRRCTAASVSAPIAVEIQSAPRAGYARGRRRKGGEVS